MLHGYCFTRFPLTSARYFSRCRFSLATTTYPVFTLGYALARLVPPPRGFHGTLQAASHPFITGQPHPRDLGALTIADDPLISDRYTRQMQAMQLQYQKDQQEAERKRALRIRQQVRMLSLNKIGCALLTRVDSCRRALPRMPVSTAGADVYICVSCCGKGTPPAGCCCVSRAAADFIVIFRHDFFSIVP